MKTKTSTRIRKAVDKFLMVCTEDDYLPIPNSNYLCDVLDESAICRTKLNEIKETFIEPYIKSGLGLFSHLMKPKNQKEYLRRQTIRFTLAEFIACYYEGIGD